MALWRQALNRVRGIDGDDLAVEIGPRGGAGRRGSGAQGARRAHTGSEGEHGGEKNEGAFLGGGRHARISSIVGWPASSIEPSSSSCIATLAGIERRKAGPSFK